MKTKEQLKKEILNDFVPDWEKEGWKFSYDSNDIEKLVDKTIEKAREGWIPKEEHEREIHILKDALKAEEDYRKMLDEIARKEIAEERDEKEYYKHRLKHLEDNKSHG